MPIHANTPSFHNMTLCSLSRQNVLDIVHALQSVYEENTELIDILQNDVLASKWGSVRLAVDCPTERKTV